MDVKNPYIVGGSLIFLCSLFALVLYEALVPDLLHDVLIYTRWGYISFGVFGLLMLSAPLVRQIKKARKRRQQRSKLEGRLSL